MTEYSVTNVVLSSRWKIVHRTPGEAVTERVYFVQKTGPLFSCSCPGYRFHRLCKHSQFVRKLASPGAMLAV